MHGASTRSIYDNLETAETTTEVEGPGKVEPIDDLQTGPGSTPEEEEAEVEEEDIEKEHEENLAELKNIKDGEPDRAAKIEDLENKLTNSASDAVQQDSENKNLFEVNDEVANKMKGGVITEPDLPGSHVDFGDIIFEECELEETFGISGNMPNPKCAQTLFKAKKRLASKKANQKDIITRANSKWPTTVPYSIKNITDTADRWMDEFMRSFDKARWDFGNKTCLRFRVKNARDVRYFDFKRGAGCSSHVGKRAAVGGHTINIAAGGCDYPKTVSHEMMHALGFWHEQSRKDRNDSVRINFANIKVERGLNMSYNFEIAQNSNAHGYDYDYESIMHYHKFAFGIEDRGPRNRPRQTIFSRDPNVASFGSCNECGLTEIDALQVNFRYCNQPRAVISRAEVRAVTRRWMLIYNQRSSGFMARKLAKHLQDIFAQYRFIVIASAQLPGIARSHSRFNCATVRAFGLDVTVCYNRPTGNALFNRAQVLQRVRNAFDGKSCTIQFHLRQLRGLFGRGNIVGYKKVPFGFDSVARWNTNARVTWLNFNCRNRSRASVAILHA